jgi:invasion protein IalB
MSLAGRGTGALVVIVLLSLMPLRSHAGDDDRRIGNWSYSCATDGACTAFIGLRSDTESVVAWSIQKSRTTGEINSIITVPLGVILQAGVRVYTSEDRFFSLEYRICRPDGCSASGVMDDAAKAQLATADTARVVYFFQEPGEEARGVSYELSVTGAREVLAAID